MIAKDQNSSFLHKRFFPMSPLTSWESMLHRSLGQKLNTLLKRKTNVRQIYEPLNSWMAFTGHRKPGFSTLANHGFCIFKMVFFLFLYPVNHLSEDREHITRSIPTNTNSLHRAGEMAEQLRGLLLFQKDLRFPISHGGSRKGSKKC